LNKSDGLRRPIVIWLAALGVAVGTAAVAYFLATGSAESFAKNDSAEHLAVTAEEREARITQIVAEQGKKTQRLSTTPAIRDAAETVLSGTPGSPTFNTALDTLGRSTASVVEADSDLLEVLLIGEGAGTVFFATEAGHYGTSRRSASYFAGGKERPTLQPLWTADDTGVPTVTISAPLFSGTGERLGVLVAHFGLGTVIEALAEGSGLGDTGRTYLVLEEGTPVGPSSLDGGDLGPVSSVAVGAVTGGHSGTGVYGSHSGRRVVGAYRWLPGLGAGLIVELDESEVVAPARRVGWAIIGIGAIVMLPILTGGYVRVRGRIRAEHVLS
jgi:hypothetical protein